jgi:CRISPR-associated protein Cas2
MIGAKWWLVSYDVRNAKRLRQAAQKVLGRGQRMQYSVYRCWLTPRELERLRWELTEVLLPEDEVLFIPLCERCHGGIRMTYAELKELDWPVEPPRHMLA